MKLGIDFGTTRMMVAFVDDGNYPVVVFEPPDGVERDWFPPLVAIQGARRLFGWEAWAVQEEPGWTVIRSLKRALGGASLASEVEIAGQTIPLRTAGGSVLGAAPEPAESTRTCPRRGIRAS